MSAIPQHRTWRVCFHDREVVILCALPCSLQHLRTSLARNSRPTVMKVSRKPPIELINPRSAKFLTWPVWPEGFSVPPEAALCGGKLTDRCPASPRVLQKRKAHSRAGIPPPALLRNIGQRLEPAHDPPLPTAFHRRAAEAVVCSSLAAFHRASPETCQSERVAGSLCDFPAFATPRKIPILSQNCALSGGQ